EYLAAGVAFAGGVALMFTGVGGPAGVALMAASGGLMAGGVSVASQKATTGEVDWGRAGTDALVGAVGGGAAGATSLGLANGARALAPTITSSGANTATQTLATAIRPAATRSAIAAGTGGAASN